MKCQTQLVGFISCVVMALVLEVVLAQDTPRTIISSDFFNSLLSQDGNCEGKGFYTYDAFISAAESYDGFGTTGSTDIRKRELAAFFANAMHETTGFCYINELNRSDIHCNPSYQRYPCAAGKSYFGRGPLQLSWNYNYGAAGQAIGSFDGLNNPEIMAQDVDISFKTAVWFWMFNSVCHQGITTDGGFVSTISAINPSECHGGAPDKVQSRVNFYLQLCQQLGVDPGQYTSC